TRARSGFPQPSNSAAGAAPFLSSSRSAELPWGGGTRSTYTRTRDPAAAARPRPHSNAVRPPSRPEAGPCGPNSPAAPFLPSSRPVPSYEKTLAGRAPPPRRAAPGVVHPPFAAPRALTLETVRGARGRGGGPRRHLDLHLPEVLPARRHGRPDLQKRRVPDLF